MEFLQMLAEHRTPFLTGFFSLVTSLGSETVMLVLLVLLVWCVNKKQGFRTGITMALGLCVSLGLKLAVREPRPYTKSPGLAVESAVDSAADYSFPSGHCLETGSVMTSLILWLRKRWATVVLALLMLLVACSRLYLGVHTPQDVLAGLALGILVALGTDRLYALTDGIPGRQTARWIGMLVFAAAAAVYACLQREDPENPGLFADSMKNMWISCGLVPAFVLGEILDERKLHYEVKAVWWAQGLKVALGLGLVMGIRVGLKAVLPDAYWTNGVRYFAMGAFATAVWPLTFGWFSRLGRKA